MTSLQLKEKALFDLAAKLGDRPATGIIMLSVNMQAMMRGSRGGYPVELYHEQMSPVLALTADQENLYIEHGYGRTYKKQFYPKCLFRRNMNESFRQRSYLEERFVSDKEHEERAKGEDPPSGCGPWMDELSQLEAMPKKRVEAPEVTIARMEERLRNLGSEEEEPGPVGKRKGK